ncbi:pre-rRNA 2'-O-ribose RNA methyltransferase FTSJ3 [Bombina bombina]|uniref:pre-rRNA 2'-O-ribose RNA methyltransferase FTSJ3 n=1 Tax=Bombina bombina TaxID=8345 RepID=UPI00235ABD06|nr:pre-rRNA 2'-O-ribose RNA methyltransferase FTSJ3 [Bombina bombina]
MGKKGKVGKSRKDKFYHLAKETGYRSRSAFKLIQLNRKFQFLQRARALVDLCAAPGGWLQVASKFMPLSSLIIGVDIVPIKSIPNVVTLQQDITTEECRQALKKQLQTWKADVVLNDGAPNVGANWTHDAFSQVHLSLMALRVACDCLSRGGWFITKIFRSSDYQSLLWILQQFFKKVNSTKPQASRSESAEIFVVCQGFLAPDKIDNKFFDPKFAFKEVEGSVQTVSQLLSQKKPKAEGYDSNSISLYHRASLIDFLKCDNPVDFLAKTSEIVLDNTELEKYPATSNDIRECCKDIKVLGRKELRSLLSWRSKLRRHLAKKLKESKEQGGDIELSSGEEEEEKEGSVGEKEKPSEDEEEVLDKKLAEMKAEELAKLKRQKKKLLKVQRRQRERVELKMDLPGVSIADEGETGMFSLRSIGKSELLQTISHGDMSVADSMLSDIAHNDGEIVISGDEEDEISLASDLDDDDLEEVRKQEQKSESKRVPQKEDISQEDEELSNPLLVPLEEASEHQQRNTNLWFGKGVFSCMDFDADEDLEIKQTQILQENKREEKTPKSKDRKKMKTSEISDVAHENSEPKTTSDGAKVAVASNSGDMTTKMAEESPSSLDSDSSEDETDIRSMKKGLRKKKKQEKEETDGFEVVSIERPVKRSRILDAEGLALGTVIATSKKATRDLIDSSFGRYAFNDDEEELPDWFVSEEKKHRILQLPVDRQTVAEYRMRQRELNARPIKKVAEAKARKRRRMLKKMEQAKKKAEAVVNTVDITEKEKVAQLRSVYKKAGLGKEKRQVTYVVAKKGAGRKVSRPAGIKGHFKVVDGRMKKDRRGQKSKR